MTHRAVKCARLGGRGLIGGWLLTLALAGCQTTAPAQDPPAARKLIVTFEPQPGTAPPPAAGSARTYFSGGDWHVSAHIARRIEAIERRHGVRHLDGWPIQTLDVYCAVFATEDGRELDALIDRIASEPGIDAAQRFNEFQGLTGRASRLPNDPHFTLQYGSNSELIAALHDITRGHAVEVGIVDTLVDDQHPDLKGQIARQLDFTEGAADDPEQRQHGTAVAGVLAARTDNAEGVAGLVPEASLTVYGGCVGTRAGGARCNSFDLAKALESVIANRPAVLNLSLAGPDDPLLRRLLERIIAADTIVIAADNGAETEHRFPASMSRVIGVDTSTAGPLQPVTTDTLAPFLDRWILNPEKLSTLAGGGYRFFYGSSMSAASLSGFAVLLHSLDGERPTARWLRALLAADCRALALSNRNAQPMIGLVRESLECLDDRDLEDGVAAAAAAQR